MSEDSLANALERALEDLQELRRKQEHLQVACDLACNENSLLRAEIGRIMRANYYTCNVCGASWRTLGEADACHVRHGGQP